MKKNFVTYFTSDFASIGMASVSRFMRFHPNAFGHIFTFDENTEGILKRRFPVADIRVLNVFSDNFLASLYSSLAADRNELEVITSLKPTFIRLVLEQLNSGDQLIYFDPDIMHFSEFSSLVNESVFVFKQKGVLDSSSEKYGEFNAGFVMVKKNEDGISMIRHWENRCIDWCKLEVRDGLYADQKYLDDFKTQANFGYLQSFQHNLSTRAFTRSEDVISLQKTGHGIMVNGCPLVTFHFHGIRIDGKKILTGINRFGRIRPKHKLFIYVYLPVLRDIALEHFRFYSAVDFPVSHVRQHDKTFLKWSHKLEKIPYVTLLIPFLRFINLTEIPLIVVKYLNGKLFFYDKCL